MNKSILVTGSSGLVGAALVSALSSMGARVTQLDIRATGTAQGDIREQERVRRAIADVDGVIHLAAVSRVIWGEQDPDLCWATNVVGLRNVLENAAGSRFRPWVIFASSREVYGQPEQLPATEESPAQPVNVYGKTKIEGERLVLAAQHDKVRACTIRLSNVFGSPTDHADRVVPAFARAAVLNAELRVDGADNSFDFTHIDDVTRGIVSLVELLGRTHETPPPIHFVSGVPTTLGELAQTAIRIAKSRSRIRLAAPREFDVARFVGSPARAEELLDWRPRVSLEQGLTRLIREFQTGAAAQECTR